MAREIERKFLVRDDRWRSAATAVQAIAQGYLARTADASVRVRIVDGKTARLTIKSGRSDLAREEFEYPLPLDDARSLIALCGDAVMTKTRHRVPQGALCWEVDVFGGALDGLVLAELEMDREDGTVDLPHWIGDEVTGDARYYNASLVDRDAPPDRT